MSTLPTLADEVLAALPLLMECHPDGPSLKVIAATLGAGSVFVRDACHKLNQEGRADLLQRLGSREQFLVPLRHRCPGRPLCAICGKIFDRGLYGDGRHQSVRRTCSRKCWGSLAFRTNREQRVASLRKAATSPASRARTTEGNRRRWARPGERERLSEKNRNRWADPVQKAALSQAIASVRRTPESRKAASDARKAAWRNPTVRRRMLAGMKRVHGTPGHKAKLSANMRARWRDP